MMNRILFACLFLALSTESSSLSCRWMDHKFRQHNEETLNLLDTMAKNATNTSEVEVTVAFPNHLYHQVSKSSAEDKLAFSVQILEEVAALFEEDHSAASWEDSTVRNFLNIVNKQAEELHSCVSSLSVREVRLRWFGQEILHILGRGCLRWSSVEKGKTTEDVLGCSEEEHAEGWCVRRGCLR
uniref:Interferon a3-like n=1 Tax=Pundamilia nyererei TaxID=303518 RepID=A0A3B4F0X1_9CICH